MGELMFGFGVVMAFFSMVLLWLTSVLEPLSAAALWILAIGLSGLFIFSYIRLEDEFWGRNFIGIPAGVLIGLFTTSYYTNPFFILYVLFIICGILIISAAEINDEYLDPFILLGSWLTYIWASFALITPLAVEVLILSIIGIIAWIFYGMITIVDYGIAKLKILLLGIFYLMIPLIVSALFTTELYYTFQVTGLYIGITASALVLAVAWNDRDRGYVP
ncbi:MAG: hypothetical protein RTU63_10325 [Candidatus Thorarchaeota archaeon]